MNLDSETNQAESFSSMQYQDSVVKVPLNNTISTWNNPAASILPTISLPTRLVTGSSLSTSHISDCHASSSESIYCKIGLVIGHGLGARNPRTTDLSSDKWTPLLKDATLSSTALKSALLYTARGHGLSAGWEETAESDGGQFTWDRLAFDMLYVASSLYNQFIAAGSSMGSATAFYAAMHAPERVLGVIMIRPPTGAFRPPLLNQIGLTVP